jgi:hypothetical protein
MDPVIKIATGDDPTGGRTDHNSGKTAERVIAD